MAKNEIILCDTNIVINLFRGHSKTRSVLEKIGTDNIGFSIITFAEIVYGTKKSELNRIKTFFELHRIIDIDENVSKVFKGIVLNHSFNSHIKIPDAFIAATAISLGMPLYTENIKDFDFIPELKLYRSKKR